jgi:hypothetical protein
MEQNEKRYIWSCLDCGEFQNSEAIWCKGDLCKNCYDEKQKRDFNKYFHAYMKQQIKNDYENSLGLSF